MSGEEESSNTDEWQSFIILRVTWEDIESTSSHRIVCQNGKHTPIRYRHSNNNQQRPHHHRSNNQGRQLYGRPVKKK